jgi:hypothetical protein
MTVLKPFRFSRIKVLSIALVLAATLVSLLGAASPSVACGGCYTGCDGFGGCHGPGETVCSTGTKLLCTTHSWQYVCSNCC